MNTYYIKKSEHPLSIFSPMWGNANVAQINCSPWDKGGYKPFTTARVLYSESGIAVKMETDEKPLLSRFTENNSPVCTDSCMEFFFRPNKNDLHYFNFEFNPNGAMLLGYGEERNSLELIKFDKSVFEVESVIAETWLLKFFIPFSFTSQYVDGFSENFFGNFYKCGDETPHPHWICWNEIKTPEPDFHQPEYFGELVFISV